MTTAAHVTSLRRGQHSADRRLISATSSLKQCVRNNLVLLDLKARRDWGWVTNPSRAAYSRVSNRTTRGCVVLAIAGVAAISFLVAAIAADTTEERRAFPMRRRVNEKQRAAAPTAWDRMVSETFLKDAFSVVGAQTTNGVSGQVPVPQVPPPHKEFDRSALMKTLSQAEEAISQAVASEKSFTQQAALLNKQIEVVAGIAATLKTDDPDYKDDEDYQRFVQAMLDSATSMQGAIKKTSYEASGVSFGRLKQACDSCHGEFR